jgi:hypothetical protein
LQHYHRPQQQQQQQQQAAAAAAAAAAAGSWGDLGFLIFVFKTDFCINMKHK